MLKLVIFFEKPRDNYVISFSLHESIKYDDRKILDLNYVMCTLLGVHTIIICG